MTVAVTKNKLCIVWAFADTNYLPYPPFSPSHWQGIGGACWETNELAFWLVPLLGQHSQTLHSLTTTTDCVPRPHRPQGRVCGCFSCQLCGKLIHFVKNTPLSHYYYFSRPQRLQYVFLWVFLLSIIWSTCAFCHWKRKNPLENWCCLKRSFLGREEVVWRWSVCEYWHYLSLRKKL